MITETRIDQKRGCGWRKPGGLYLVGPETGQPCGLLPVPLDRCPCCDQGIKPTRGWTWIDVPQLLAGRECRTAGDPFAPQSKGWCYACPARQLKGRHGLLWIGEAFYPTPADWLKEAHEQGISRRLHQLPRGFKVGETWVLVAHRKAIANEAHVWEEGDGTRHIEEAGFTPGVFQMFKPTAVEYVVKGGETDEELEAMVKRGLTPVKVVHDDGTLFSEVQR